MTDKFYENDDHPLADDDDMAEFVAEVQDILADLDDDQKITFDSLIFDGGSEAEMEEFVAGLDDDQVVILEGFDDE